MFELCDWWLVFVILVGLFILLCGVFLCCLFFGLVEGFDILMLEYGD